MTMTPTSETFVGNQFPQPARPPNSYDDFELIPSTSRAYPLQSPSKSSYPQQSIDHSYKVSDSRCGSGKQELKSREKVSRVDKALNRILDKYEKLPATIRDHVNLEELLAKERDREVNSQSSNSRGLEQSIEVGPPEKLERFKIRTVVAGEVVTEDENKK